MREIAIRRNEHGIKVELDEEARDWLAQEGYDVQFGARPLRRTLQRYVENPLSKRILAGDFHEGDTVIVEIGENAEGKRAARFQRARPRSDRRRVCPSNNVRQRTASRSSLRRSLPQLLPRVRSRVPAPAPRRSAPRRVRFAPARRGWRAGSLRRSAR